jgi:hypothetical protein
MAALLRRLELMFAWEEIRCRQRNIFRACEVKEGDVMSLRDGAAGPMRTRRPPLADRDPELDAGRAGYLARTAEAVYNAPSRV